MAVREDGNTTMPEPAERGLTFPIRLRCTHTDDLFKNTALEDALARARARAFPGVRRPLPASVAFGGGVVLRAPERADSGFPPDARAALLARVGRAIAKAARDQGLPLAKATAPPAPRPAHPAAKGADL